MIFFFMFPVMKILILPMPQHLTYVHCIGFYVIYRFNYVILSIGTSTTKHRQRLDCFICCCDRCLVFILFHLGEFCIFLPPLHYIYGRSYLLEGVCFFVVYFCCLGICCTSALWFFVFVRSWFFKVCVFVLFFLELIF